MPSYRNIAKGIGRLERRLENTGRNAGSLRFTMLAEIETFQLVPVSLLSFPAKQITPDDVRKSSYNLPLLTTRRDRYS